MKSSLLRAWVPHLVLFVMLGEISLVVAEQDLNVLVVGTIRNLGPDLQTIAGGADGIPGDVELFADVVTLDQQLGLPSPTALYYADGMRFDVKGNFYGMANRADEVDVLSPDGKLIHRYAGTGANAMSFNASPIFKGSKLFMTNTSATDGGVNSKLSVLQAPFSGVKLQ